MSRKKKRFLSRIMAFLLVMTLGCPTISVQAADINNVVEQGEVIESGDLTESEIPKLDTPGSSDDGNGETIDDPIGIDVDVIEDSDENFEIEGVEEEEVSAEETEETEIEQCMNWVYVESSYLETPDTQRVVVSWGDGTESIEEMTLTVQDSNGAQEEWTLSNSVEDLYLFEKEYTDASQNGTYEAIALTVKTEETEKTFTMAEMEAEVLFGVNEEYAGIEELKAITEDGSEEDAEVSASVATISEDGTLEAQESIAAALEQAGAEVQAETMPAKSRVAKSRAAVSASDTRAGNIVVALDPGHDASDAGASGNGLREEVLTLKIANYCKAELEQYAGVTVYMTRTGAACPYGKSGISCMPDRVKAASDRGAKIFVSLHLNATGYGTAYGAEVIVPNNNWKPDIGSSGAALGNKILDELVKLGLARRRVYSKDTTLSYETYPDGSKSDYFSVQVNCKYYGIPGIIVEHAFIDNVGDANKYLKTEAGLKSLGVADATGIAKYLGLSKGRWETDKQGNTYYYENGQKVIGTGKKIGGYWYYFAPVTGIMQKNYWRDKDGEKYYYDENGRMYYSVGKKIDGWWYYFDSKGIMQRNYWRDKDGEKYYYDENGRMYYSVGKKIDGWWYYFDSKGIMQRNYWRDKDGEKYYYDENGRMYYSVGKKIDGWWYYFDSKGIMQRNYWRDKDGEKYYYDENGRMYYSVGKKIDGWWYYFDSKGIMQRNYWRDKDGEKYYYDENGRMYYSVGKKIDGWWYYFDSKGIMQRNYWRDKDGEKYYYNENGRMYYSVGKKIDGWWYYFDSKGIMQRNYWRDKDGEKYYYDENGRMYYSVGKKIDGWWYYFDSKGIMQRNYWRDKGGKKYYYDENGRMLYDTRREIDGVWYEFNSDGSLKIKSYLITGQSSVTVNQMVKYFASSGITYPKDVLGRGGAATIQQFCQIYYEECSAEGIKTEVAFVQAMLETGFLQFGGDVKVEQYNFAGLGATGGTPGNSFKNVREGVRAHIQHLKCYANDEPLNNPCVDPRWGEWLRNKAPYVEWLSIPNNPYGTGWAEDALYGVKIISGIDKLKTM